MAKILTPIPPRAFTLIRNRICEILADELKSQSALEYDADLDADVFLERFVPFDKTDMPAVNILLAKGDFDNKAVVKKDGTYTFNIDCYVTCKTQTGKEGDTQASIKLQKLMGVCDAILESPLYKTLGFTPPFISHTEVRSLNIANPVNNQDASSVMMGRLQFIVRCPENVDVLLPKILAGYDTSVKMALTNKGYFYSVNSSSPPTAIFETSPDPASGIVPLTVIFTDLSTNTPTSWLWQITGGTLGTDYEFTDGSATSQNPTIRFITIGVYNVTLKVTNAFGNNTSDPKIITIIASPCDPVSIINQYDIEIASVPAGGTYQVEQLEEIIDTIDNNQVTIIDPIT